MNVEDFYGGIEFFNVTVTKNFQYVPEIYMYNHSRENGYGLSPFDVANLSEYAFANRDLQPDTIST